MLSKNQISYIKSLHQKKFRQMYGKFLVEGAKNVQELLHSTWVTDVVYCTDAIENYANKELAIEQVSELELQKISTLSTPDRAVAVAQVAVAKELVLPSADKFYLLLDGINDPGNLGAIIRIADWFGWHSIYLSENCVDVYNPKTVSAAKGSLFRTHCQYCNLLELIGRSNMPVYGAVFNGANVYSQKFNSGGLLLIGSEANGISENLEPLITNRISIPAFGKAESLNAAVATGILVSEIMRRNQ